MNWNDWYLRACTVVGLAVLFAGCSTSGLNNGGTPTSLVLAVRSGADNTKNHPTNTSFVVNASCGTAEQMVGGGYQFINNSNAYPTLVVVEGNFPSAKNTWTVRVRNPDNPPYNGDADVVVQALAYCVTTPNFDLNTEIISNGTTIRSGTSTPTDIDVRCSQTTALALSGGFSTSSLPPIPEQNVHYQTFWPALEGTGITASGPRLPDSSHSSMGWHIVQEYTPLRNLTAPHPDVTTNAYVLCARSGLNLQSRRIVTTTGILQPGGATATTTPQLDAFCSQGEFTVGGGYDHFPVFGPSCLNCVSEIQGGFALQSPFNFVGWHIIGDSAYARADALALCVRIPQ